MPDKLAANNTLVGRDAELTLLDGLLDALPAGESGVVYIAGPPGIGKSALVAEALARADERGCVTLSGSAAEFERDLPFATFAEPLEGRLSPADLERVGLPAGMLDQTGLAGGALVASRTERYRLLCALQAALEALGAAQPLVLALDDLHWADSASIDLLCRLLQRGLACPSLLLLALRDSYTEQRLRTAVHAAERRGHLCRLDLAPLSFEEAAALLTDVPDPRVRKLIYSECGGNPLYLEQLAAASARGSHARVLDVGGTTIGVPAAIAAAIDSELATLSHDGLELLRGAAVTGDPFEPDLAAEAAAIGELPALVALDELLERDLVRPGDSPRRFRFRHAIVRRAVYEASGAGWRLAAHMRAATALESRGASAAVRAPHVERSARAGDGTAVALLIEAGEETLSHAPATAAHWFDAALQLLPARDHASESGLRLLAQRAAGLGIAGHIKESRDALHEFLALAPARPDDLRLNVTVLTAILDELLGTHDAGRALLLDELARFPDESGPAAAELSREIAFTYFLDADWDRTAAWARKALTAGCEGMVRVGATAALALAEFGRGELGATCLAVDEAASIYDALTDAALVAHHPAIAIWLGWAEVCTERFPRAVAHLERAVAASSGAGQRHLTVGMLAVQAQALALAGRCAELDRVAEVATEEALLTASDLLLSWAMTVRCQTSVLASDLDEAVRAGEHGIGAAAAASSPLSGIARSQLAGALLEAGEPERCRELLTNADEEPDLPPFPLYEASCFEMLTRAELARGHRERADAFAARAEQVAARRALGVPLAQALRARSAVLLDAGTPGGAVEAARTARDAASNAGAPVEAARAQILAGRALAAAGNRTAALAELQLAYDVLGECGTVHYREQAARELRRRGRAVARHRAPGGGEMLLGLTDRELEVMQLIAVGKKNREIAERLFLSVRTVDRHVSRIFDKLNVGSRAAASSVYERARQDGS